MVLISKRKYSNNEEDHKDNEEEHKDNKTVTEQRQ